MTGTRKKRPTIKLVLKVLIDKLNICLSTADKDITHTVGRFLTDGNRQIVCKYASRFTKHEVIKVRRLLKGTAKVGAFCITFDLNLPFECWEIS